MPDADNIVDAIEAYQYSRGGAHRAGTLMKAPLQMIDYYLKQLLGNGPIKSVETGCGASTILFARSCASHRSYCLDDRATENSSVDFACGFPGFVKDRVDFVFGPTQKTIFQSPLEEQVDIALIDGPHGYPFPELEYFAFYRWIKPGGILILDDIHIPTINNLYRFLCEDDMFYFHSIVDSTAFFQRSQSDAMDHHGDGWWLQRYNIQRFPAYNAYAYKVNSKPPFSMRFEGSLSSLNPYFQRGFILSNGSPVTESPLSIMNFPVDGPLSGDFEVELELEAVATPQRPNAAVSIYLNEVEMPIESFAGVSRRILSFRMTCEDAYAFSIKFHNHDLIYADEIANWPSAHFDKRLPGFRVLHISIKPSGKQHHEGSSENISRHDGSIVSFDYKKTDVKFFVNQQTDSIQSYHYAGQFYEREELELIARHIAHGASVLDIGANIGNHTVYFAKVLKASRIVVIEPQVRAGTLLRTNCAINNLTQIEFQHLGIAFGEETANGSISISDPANPGGAVVKPYEAGTVQISAGDAVLANEVFDFIKVDVEGSEVAVVKGLVHLIERSKPVIFVEVWDVNRKEFDLLIEAIGYHIADEWRRYDTMTNLLLKPKV